VPVDDTNPNNEYYTQVDIHTSNSDANPIRVYGRNEQGRVSEYVLWTATLYANYVLNTAKGS
jgi:hypothetical protein